MSTWRVKMSTQNLRLRLLRLLMLVMRIVLATVCCKFWSWGLVKKLNFFVQTLSTRFGQYFEIEAQAILWCWSLVDILMLNQHCWCFVETLKLSLVKVEVKLRFWRWSFNNILMVMFVWDFKVVAWSRLWSWHCHLTKICVRICYMT